MKNINEHIRQTARRIAEMEESLKNSKDAASNYAASIRRLRADVEARTQQVAALEQEVEKMRAENATLAKTVNEKDSVLVVKDDLIQMKEQDIAALETRVEEINTASRMSQADLYFAQAQALET